MLEGEYEVRKVEVIQAGQGLNIHSNGRPVAWKLALMSVVLQSCVMHMAQSYLVERVVHYQGIRGVGGVGHVPSQAYR